MGITPEVNPPVRSCVVNLKMAVSCPHSCRKVTAGVSDRDKHADSISQLNGNRKSATPFFPTEQYANKLLPTCPCGVTPCADPSLALAAVGRRAGRAEPRPHRATVCGPEHRNKTSTLTVAGFLLCFAFLLLRHVSEPVSQTVKSRKAAEALREGR